MKTCLILGSNSDAGQATAYRFANEGFNILLATRDVSDYQKRLAADISIRNNVQAQNVCFDGSKYNEHESFYTSLPVKPDVVVSVFGILGNHTEALKNFDEAQRIIDANYTAHVSILNIVASDMEQRKSGTIIGISSVAGERGRKSNYIYGSAKAGLTAYLSGLRNRLSSSGVHVVTVLPGFINTKMTKGLPLPKPVTAQPEDVAKAIWNAYVRKKNVVYVLPVWKWIMLLIKNIPEGIFKKMNL